MEGNRPMIRKREVVCPECGAEGRISSGEIVCPSCGLVLREEVIDHGPVMKGETEEKGQLSFNPSTNKAVPLKGLGSKIGTGRYKDMDAKGSFRLMWQNKRTSEKYCPSSLRESLLKLNDVANKLKLPSYVLETGAIYYRKLYVDSFLVGKKRNKVVGGVMMLLCREFDLVRTPKEISRAAGVGDTARDGLMVLDYYKKVSDKLNKDYHSFGIKDYTKKLCEEFSIMGDLRTELLKYAEEMEGEAGYNPRCIAAAILYIAVRREDLDITQRKVAETADVSCVSIRNRYKQLENRFGIDT